jgi:hypothetical protein
VYCVVSLHAGEIFPGRGIFTLINRVVRLIQPREGGGGPPTSYPWEQKRLVNNSSPFYQILLRSLYQKGLVKADTIDICFSTGTLSAKSITPAISIAADNFADKTGITNNFRIFCTKYTYSRIIEKPILKKLEFLLSIVFYYCF